MAWRILEYRTLALEEAVKLGVAGPNCLRPLFLGIVIYNGTEAWNDPAAGERPVPRNLLDYESPRLYRLRRGSGPECGGRSYWTWNVAAQLPALLEGLSEADRVAVVAAAVLQCETEEEFIARTRSDPGVAGDHGQ